MRCSLFSAYALLIFAFAEASWATSPPFQCTANAGVPPIVSVESITALVGDLLFNCTGGTPTPPGQTIPTVTITVTLNTNVTGRLLGSNSEAVLTIDEPFPATPVPNTAVPGPSAPAQQLCFTGPCAETGTGGSPSPYQTQPNVFIGQQTAANTITWTGIPLDPPGNIQTRIIRITNILADASQIGLSNTLTPSQVVLSFSVTGAQPPVLNNGYPAQQTVAFVEQGFLYSVPSATSLSQCSAHNGSLIGGTGTAQFDTSIQLRKGYTSSWLRRNVGLSQDGSIAPLTYSQNLLGYPYGTETGFYTPELFAGTPELGLSDYGTRIRLSFQNIGTGARLFAPVSLPLVCATPPNNLGCSTGQPVLIFPTPPPVPPGISTSQIRLVQADQYGVSVQPGYTSVPATGSVGGVPVAEVVGGSAVYEVVGSNSNFIETADIPVAVAYTSGSGMPGLGTATVSASLAPAEGPVAGIHTADPTAPIPRFVNETQSPIPVYTIFDCSAPTVVIQTTPPGLQIVVDSATLTAPQSFNYVPGTQHTISVPSPQDSAGTRYVFSNWSDGGAQSHQITVTTTETLFTATLQPSAYLVSTPVTPPGSGTIVVNPTSPDGFYAPGATVQFTATPATGYFFQGWTGSAFNGPLNPLTFINIRGPVTETATFGNIPVLSVAASPSFGTGLSQPFAFTWSDSGGASDINSVAVLLNTSLNGAGACFLIIDVAGHTYLFADDTGSNLTSLPFGASGLLQNSQCALNGSNLSFGKSGNDASLQATINFKAAFAGTKQIFLWIKTNEGLTNNWQTFGSWTIPSTPALLSIAKTHTGNFTQGQQNATYLLNVSNASGAGPTNGTVIVSETIPSELTLISMSGTGWNCSNGSCTRSDALPPGSHYPPITVAVNVAANAPSLQVNQVSVSGGGSQTAIATDPTAIMAAGSVPQAVSVTPASGTGATQQFTFVWSDASGAADIATTAVIFNTSLNGVNACFFLVDPVHQNLLFADDSSSHFSALGVGSAGSVQNSQCVLNGSGSMLTKSGNNLTLTMSINFKPAFAGTKQTYMWVQNNAGATNNWQDNGAWTVPGNSQPPQAGPVTPGSGAGAAQQFTFVWSDPNGAADISAAAVIFNTSINGPGACFFIVDPVNRNLMFADDSGSHFNVLAIGSSGSLQNSQCVLSGPGSTLTALGNNLTLVVSIAFNAAFAGTKQTFLWVQNKAGVTNNWQDAGSWTVPAPAPSLSITKTHSGNFAQGQQNATYNVTVSNASGAAPTSGTVTVTETVPAGLTLVSMSGTGWNCSNTSCTRSDALAGGTNYPGITVTVNVSNLAQSPQVNQVSVSGGGSTAANASDPTVISGSVLAAPTAVSATPSSGTGATQQFTFVWSDPSGFADISGAAVLFNSSINGQGACFFVVDPQHRNFLFGDDSGSNFTVLPVGSPGSLQNSQCVLNGSGSTLTGSGNTLTLTVTITFKPSFAGTQSTFMWVNNSAGMSSWQNKGSWTISGGNQTQAVSVSPSSGSAATQQFTFVWSDTSGFGDITGAAVLFNTSINGQGACFFVLDPVHRNLFFADDSGSNFSVLPVGSAGSVGNSQCTLQGSSTALTGSGNNLTLTVTVTFQHAFAGAKSTFMWVQNAAGTANWQNMGNWTVP